MTSVGDKPKLKIAKYEFICTLRDAITVPMSGASSLSGEHLRRRGADMLPDLPAAVTFLSSHHELHASAELL